MIEEVKGRATWLEVVEAFAIWSIVPICIIVIFLALLYFPRFQYGFLCEEGYLRTHQGDENILRQANEMCLMDILVAIKSLTKIQRDEKMQYKKQ